MPEMELFGPERPTPEMELFGPDPLAAVIRSHIWRRLLAYMFWPADERRRKAYILRPYLDVLASIDEKYEGDPDHPVAHWFVYKEFRHLGGSAILEAESEEPLEKRIRVLRTAAAILDIIRKAPNGTGSLNKAIHTIEATAQNYNLIQNRTDIKRAWASHRWVSHLGVALVFTMEPQGQEDLNDPVLLKTFLVIARDYEAFATSYRLPGQKEHLLDAVKTWTIPADFHSLPRLGILTRLPEDMTTALRSYRAPQ